MKPYSLNRRAERFKSTCDLDTARLRVYRDFYRALKKSLRGFWKRQLLKIRKSKEF